MLEPRNNNELPAIPGKRYFTIGEVSELCGVKPHVLRYWEQEFPQLKPVKRRGQPPLLPAPGRDRDPPDQEPAVRAGLHHLGARQKLEGEEARSDVSQSQQIVRQLRAELEDILRILRR